MEFCYDNLQELAFLPEKDIDIATANLHKALDNVDPAQNWVRLNTTNYTTLHAIEMQCTKRVNCNSPFTNDNITNVNQKNITEMLKNDYLETTLKESPVNRLGEIKVPKLSSSKWIKFKTTIIESLSWIIGKNEIPFSYII